MRTKHTPGTWVLDSDPGGRLYVAQEYQGKPGGRICEVFQNCLVDPNTKRANGNILAAAPELLEQLRNTADMLRSACIVITDAEARQMALETVAEARAAIAKATGEKA
ncbi:hypothetical protein NK8_12430 [Caballeronia sp. NK8]|uniref:hypothetical protein n=1 Tax=Caballeronia sp. NK8 TaxID=140098 RepID=UPI001BB54FBE|nr:hypothetical protein [Caballeronia sp. NK8]BCQ23118.1 hypothetical protein NK8_12430 [Caballeronia sp. NK8]